MTDPKRVEEIRASLAKATRPSKLSWREQLHADIAHLLSELDAALEVVEKAKLLSKSHEPVRLREYEGREYLSPAGIMIDGELLIGLQSALTAFDARPTEKP